MKKELYDQIQEIENTHWWYIARRKIIFDFVLKKLEKYASPRVLDVGCGTGFNIEYLKAQDYPQVFGLDFSPHALTYCQSRHLEKLACGDGTHPPFQAASFDMVMALDIIEHLEDDTPALENFARLLKPQGTLVVFTPAFQFLWSLQDEVSHHYRRYTARQLRRQVERTGLRIEKLTYVNTFLFPIIWAARIILRIRKVNAISENVLHPSWSNDTLMRIFAAERFLLRYINLPFGVSLFCIAHKTDDKRG